jgi:hypothetical protein
MAVDYTGFALPKGRPKALDKADKAKALAAQDKAESAKARKRAGGRCEVRFESVTSPQGIRCISKDTETHHLLGGIGRRNRGESVLATRKLRTCHECHRLITAKLLQPTTAGHTAATVRYRRIR